MIDGATREIWLHRVLFLAIALALLFWRLLPLPLAEAGSCTPEATFCRFWVWLDRVPGPDLLLCVILAWTMRRPDYLPVLLIAGVVLLEDLLLMRPPGLWTALVLMSSEFVRGRVALTRELNFAVEWLLVTGLMFAMIVIYRLIFAIVLLPQPGLGFALVQLFWSVLFYPAVVYLSRVVLDLRKPAMGEVDAYGRRL
ncbi:rod shape-determining protein MreD [Cypionkella sp.]|jgi:rod shape-determining protein MreD|uniref:rod shape-determining protein MreD n=1 Tax=Cypionkella sp. TaxID=2811411 RepID=UPI003750B45C